MPKRQEKIIFLAPKKETLSSSVHPRNRTLQLFVLPIVFSILFLLSVVFIESLRTPSATANQFVATAKTPVIYASSLIVSPSPAQEAMLPISEALQNTGIQTATNEAVLEPPYVADYCLDVPVLTYHHIQPLKLAELLGHKVLTADSTIFEEQIKYLKDNGYTAIAAEDLVTALQTKTQLPEKSVIITIDDGYDDNYTYAFMTAKKHKFLMNFMIPTELIDTTGYMQWEHLQEMAHNPYARIYNHTTSHAPLGLLSKDQITAEVTKANSDLQAQLGLENTIVTYPYGSYDNEAIQTLKDIGIQAAFSTDHGKTHCTSTIMRLPRLRIGNAQMSEYGL